MSNDVIILAILKPEMVWEWSTCEVYDTSYYLPLFVVDILGRNVEIFYSLDKMLRDVT